MYDTWTLEYTALLICYLIGSVTFIVGLKMLSGPATARKGNLIAATGMIIAILGTIFLYREGDIAGMILKQKIDPAASYHHLHNLLWIFGGLAVGGIIGTLSAKRVQMTAMPEMVSLFNGTGGACAMLISIVEFRKLDLSSAGAGHLLIILLGAIIGTVSFAGSMVAWGKLAGKVKDRTVPGAQIINFVLFAAIIGLSIALIGGFLATPAVFYAILAVAALYGVLFVMPIGGADMPVVISLLNSFTGVAAAFGGFLYDNPVMLTGGILVGSAGTILTILMCKAMNRSLKNVLIGSFGGNKTGGGEKREGSSGDYKEISMNDTATLLAYASKVLIIPGYGLAVAQAQHITHELEKVLEEKGVEVAYGIHPVAGRMPGHMNVLLAEADVPYEKLMEMEDANEGMSSTNVVMILGANDVVNPAAKDDPSSPIYGMPILEVEKADHVIVNKRSMKPGYAGSENELFFRPKTSMLFGDAKKVLQELVAELKAM